MSDEIKGYECVEPRLGAELWRLDDPATLPDLRRKLELHLEVCADCRFRRAVGRRVEKELVAGRLSIPEPARPSTTSPGPVGARMRWLTALRWSGAAALAAGLILVFALPPTPRDRGRQLRAGGEARFLRPVEGEILADRTPRLRWRPIRGATAYRITVDEVGGGFAWNARSTAPAVEIPVSTPLPPSSDFRAYVEPIPADLAPPGGETVSFRTGEPGAFVRYRFGAARPAVYWLGGAGLALLVAATVVTVVSRRA